jgi:hypothetical protein
MEKDKLTEKLESLSVNDFTAPVHQARLKEALFAAGTKVKKPSLLGKLARFILSLGEALSIRKPVWQAVLAGLLIMAVVVIISVSVPGILKTPNPPAIPVTVTVPQGTNYVTVTGIEWGPITLTLTPETALVTITKSVTITVGGGPPPPTKSLTTPPATTAPPATFPSISIPPQTTPTVTVVVPTQAPPVITVPIPTFTVVVPTLTIPQITIPQPTFNIPQITVIIPKAETPPMPVYMWIIIAVGAVITVAVVILIILAVKLYSGVRPDGDSIKSNEKDH